MIDDATTFFSFLLFSRSLSASHIDDDNDDDEVIKHTGKRVLSPDNANLADVLIVDK